MSVFFEEVKRRKVYRVAVAYAVGAGGAIQLASAVFPAWDLPSWALRLVIVVLLIGFPISLILAWALEVTPEGIRATPSAPATPQRRRNILALVAVGIIVSAAAGFFLLPRASAHRMDKSIAVLPFENFSEEKENAHFADGIQDDVLTNLSKISDLKVISRTSVMSYRGANRNIREIAKALGVGAILEGSVRRVGNRVRVNVQLINGATDEHIWAEDYDRELTDIFAIESELAREIASMLRTKLSPSEKEQLERKPTQNGDAYLLYVQAHDIFTRSDRKEEDARKAAQLCEKAVQMDPLFALAFAQLSQIESWLYRIMDLPPAEIEKARIHANEALRLQPKLPEAHQALGYLHYFGERDFERARSELEVAQHGLPNNAEIYTALGFIERRKGHWPEATAQLEKAVGLNPKSPDAWLAVIENHFYQRDYAAAAKVSDRAITAQPESVYLRLQRGWIEYLWKGDLQRAEDELARAPASADAEGDVTMWRVSKNVLQRQYDEAIQILNESPRTEFRNGFVPKSSLLGQIYYLKQDKERAEKFLQEARRSEEAAMREKPEDPYRHAALGSIYAMLGLREDAIREGKRAIELVPESKDAFEGPDHLVDLARIHALLGENDEAFPLLDHALSIPSGLSVGGLKLDPDWDKLRSDPRFATLIKKYGGNP